MGDGGGMTWVMVGNDIGEIVGGMTGGIWLQGLRDGLGWGYGGGTVT